jgi:hypothetical protein
MTGGKGRKEGGKERKRGRREKENFALRSSFVFVRIYRSNKKREILGGILQLFIVYVFQ